MIIEKDGDRTTVRAEIKLSTYKEERLAYFKFMQRKQKQKLEHLEKSKLRISPMERFIELSEAGMILSFYDDVVKMLEDDFTTPTDKGEVQWSGQGKCPVTPEQFEAVYADDTDEKGGEG